MNWTEDLAVGIEQIDHQHRELFERINNLLAAIKQSRCKDEIDNTIRFLEDYARTHFADEERFMRTEQYGDLPEHKKQHAAYLSNLEEIKKEAALPRIKGSSYDLSVTTNQMVVDWIVDHIMKVDKRFGEFVRSREA